MRDISAIGSKITFEGEGMNPVTLMDLSDSGSPLEFGEIEPYKIDTDLNFNFMLAGRPASPTFTISCIPRSKSDKILRAFLLSSMVSCDGGTGGQSQIYVSHAMITLPHRMTSNSSFADESIDFYEGYLVGGTSFLSISGEGRLEPSRYRFVFKSMAKSGGKGRIPQQTALYYGANPVGGLYYARVSTSSNARMISHPIETGGVIFDQKFREPERITLSVKIPLSAPVKSEKKGFEIRDAETVAQELKKMLNDRKIGKGRGDNSLTPISITTKTETFENLSLIGINHDEAPDSYDLIEYRLSFQELLFSKQKGSKTPADPSNEPSGTSQAKTAQKTRPSA